MYIIDVTLKSAPVTLSVQRKTAEDAQGLYQHILDTLKSGSQTVLELTCEQQPEKKIGVLSGEVSAVQMYEKSSTATASGRPPGFFAMTADQ